MYKNIYLTNYHIQGRRNNRLFMVRIKTKNPTPCYKHIKLCKQIESITLNISFDRKNPRFSKKKSGLM